MNKLKRKLLAVLLMVALLMPTIQVQAGPSGVVSSSDDKYTNISPEPGHFTKWFVMPAIAVSVLKFNADSLEEAEAMCSEYLALNFDYINWLLLWPSKPTKLNSDDPPSILLVRSECGAYAASLGSIGGYKTMGMEDFAADDRRLLNWFWYKIRGGVPDYNETNSSNWASDIDVLDALFARYCIYASDMFSQEDLDNWTLWKNSDGCGTYYFFVTGPLGANCYRSAINDSQIGTDLDHFVEESFYPVLPDYMLCYDTAFGAPNADSWLEHYLQYYGGDNSKVTIASEYRIVKREALSVDADYKCELGTLSYVEYGGLRYYDRSYWGGGGGTGGLNSSFVYSAEADPKDKMADLTKNQTGEYKIHLEKGAGGIAASSTYQVKVSYSPASRSYPSEYSGIDPKVTKSGGAGNLQIFDGKSYYSLDSYAGGSIKLIGSAPLNANGSFTLEMSGSQLKAWCDGSWVPSLQFVSGACADGTMLLFQPEKFVVTVTNKSSGVVSTCTPAATGKYAGWDQATSSNYCSWKDTVGGRDIPFEFHTSYDYKAYAEIIGNEVGKGADGSLNSDWNAMQGIPSTENLSVAAGGTLHVTDFAGYTHIRGDQLPAEQAALLNEGKGTANTNSVIDRAIQIQVVIDNVWGESNPRCELSCPGHTGTLSGSCSPGGTCSVCGTSVDSQKNCPTCDNDPVQKLTCGTCDKTGRVDNEDGHSCEHTFTAYCSAADGAPSGSYDSVTANLSLSDSGQSYYGTVTFTKGSESVTVNVGTSAVLCEGYTTGTGCAHNNATNCVHPGSYTYTFDITETLDIFAWKEITAGQVYILSDAEITNANGAVISDGAIGRSSSTATGQSTMWRGLGYKEGEKDPDYMYGRFWYTQFINTGTAASKLGEVVNSVEYNCKGNTSPGCPEGYFLTNTDIVIHVNANQALGNLADAGKLDDIPEGAYKDNSQGHTNNKYTDSGSSNTDYKNAEHMGDVMTESQMQTQALHIANAWQSMHSQKVFSVGILSDSFNNGSHYTTGSIFDMDTGYQNMVNAFYFVDNGIKLFNEPFTSVGERHYRNHSSMYSADQLEQMSYGAFSAAQHDGNAIIGYGGYPNSDPSVKYGYFGDSVGSAQTFSCALLFGSLIYPVVGYDHGLLTCDDSGDLRVANYYTISESLLCNEKVPEFDGVNTGFISLISWNTWSERQLGSHDGIFGDDSILYKKTFDGYYRDHTYDNLGEDLWFVFQNNNESIGDEGRLFRPTDHGVFNTLDYGIPYVISDIDIKDDARNGVYSNALEVTCNWRKTMSFANESTQGLPSLGELIPDRASGADKFSRVAVYSDTYINRAGTTGINDIVIHDPVSVEYYGIIGNGYGSYDKGVVDESGEDMRVYDKLDSNKNVVGQYTIDDESAKDNYIVMGNTFHVWVSDYGDFRDSNGSWDVGQASGFRGVNSPELGSSSYDGSSNSKARGYTDNMNTSPWVKDRYVQFTFPVSYLAADGYTIKVVPANQMIALSDVKCSSVDSSGNVVYDYVVKDFGEYNNGNWSGSLLWDAKNNKSVNMFHYGSDKLQSFSGKDIEFKCGLDYEFTLLPSALESDNAAVYFYTEAINSRDSDITVKSPNNKERDANFAASTVLYKSETVDIVGRIGNMAIEDVGDFRYSELFKRIESVNSWLIPGVIHKVDSSKPERIVATRYDILGDDTSLDHYHHAQSSLTNLIIGSSPGYGKAGYWIPMPLTSSKNPIEEYKDEQMRMGYYAYLDIETMGNYYGVNTKDGMIDRGPVSVDDMTDNRVYKMTIVPKYFLYDMTTQKFIGINMYYGNQGNRTLFWKNGMEINDDIASLYINMDGEMNRRNTPINEKTLTNKILETVSTSMRGSAFSGEDFIGTASKIVLDTFDKSYIGTTIRNGYVLGNGGEMTGQTKEYSVSDGSGGFIRFTNIYEWFSDHNWNGSNNRVHNSVGDTLFGQQQQRWYFTLGLPSSTYLTYADDDLDSQAKIEQSHDKLMEDHPNSVVICYLDIGVKGTVWQLKYDASSVNDTDNYPDIVPGNPFPKPEDPGDNIPVYGPDDEPIGEIPPDWQPVIVYDKEHTSAEDWDTYGTH